MTSMDRADTDLTIRTAAAITLKNVVKRCWEQNDKLSEDDRATVKKHIVEVITRAKTAVNILFIADVKIAPKHHEAAIGGNHNNWKSRLSREMAQPHPRNLPAHTIRRF